MIFYLIFLITTCVWCRKYRGNCRFSNSNFCKQSKNRVKKPAIGIHVIIKYNVYFQINNDNKNVVICKHTFL